MSADAPRRPVLRYYGGKWKLARWVLQHVPVHRTYVEPFGGAASVLMQKPRSYAEVYNDLNGDIVNVFRVLRDPATAAELQRLLELTPYARDEFMAAHEMDDDAGDVERARRTIVRAFMGYGSGSAQDGRQNGQSRGMRTSSSLWKAPTGYRSGTTPADDWRNYPQHIGTFVERLRGVVIENRDALEVMATHDSDETVVYLDPPYPHHTRSQISGKVRDSNRYVHELTDDDHRTLALAAHGAKGMVLISGYPSPLYDELYAGWQRVETQARAGVSRGGPAGVRTEVLWMNPRAAERLELDRSQLSLLP